MLLFPSMLANAAEEAGMKVPSDPCKFDPNQFPHFYVFCLVQLNKPNHSANAKILMKFSEEEIKKVTFEQLTANGFR